MYICMYEYNMYVCMHVTTTKTGQESESRRGGGTHERLLGEKRKGKLNICIKVSKNHLKNLSFVFLFQYNEILQANGRPLLTHRKD